MTAHLDNSIKCEDTKAFVFIAALCWLIDSLKILLKYPDVQAAKIFI